MLDGARFLARQGVPRSLCHLVVHHSASTLEAEERGIDLAVYDEFVVERDLGAGSRRALAGDRLVFTTSVGTKMLSGNVHGDFRRAPAHVPGIDPSDWTPRELRHSFVSVLPDAGVPVENLSRLIGHSGTTVTELVCRHQLKPVIQTGATVMDHQLFGRKAERA